MATKISLGRDRRWTPRVQMYRPVLTTNQDVPHSHEVTARTYVLDAGFHGCQIFSPYVFPVRTLLELVTITKAQIVRIRAYVVWVRPEPSDFRTSRWKLGLRYVMPGNHWKVQPAPASWAGKQEKRSLDEKITDLSAI